MKKAKEKKLVIFDFDGVIWDSVAVHSLAYRRVFKFFGKNYPPENNAGFRKWYDSRWENNYFKSGFSKKEMRRAEGKYWEFFDYGKSKPFKGIGRVLEKFRSEGFVLSIVSTTPDGSIRKCLRKAGLEKHFKLIIGGKKKSSKVEEIAFVLKKLGVKKQNAVMVGDTPADIEGAKANGLKNIGVAFGWSPESRIRKAKPGAIAKKPREITALLKKNHGRVKKPFLEGL